MHVVTRRVSAALSALRTLRHKREHQRKLTVHHVLELTRQREVVQREAPDHHIRLADLNQQLRHVVPNAADPRRFIPAREAAPAGRNIELVDPDRFDLRLRLRLKPLDEGPRELNRIARFALRTPV